MTKPVRTLAIVVLAVGAALVLWMVQTRSADSLPNGPATRHTWGEPDLMGVWKASKLGATQAGDTFNLAQLEGLYRPEGRAKMKQLSAEDDPSLRCLPPSFPHAATLGWPIQIVQSPGMTFIFSQAFHTFRVIPSDGRGHLSEDYLAPSFLGDSAGHWEGDTLVVDVMSFNGESWLASSEDKPTAASSGVWPTSAAMHVSERWRRADRNTLEYQAVVEDPEMLTGRWETPKITFTRQPVDTIDEMKCLVDDPAFPAISYLKQLEG